MMPPTCFDELVEFVKNYIIKNTDMRDAILTRETINVSTIAVIHYFF